MVVLYLKEIGFGAFCPTISPINEPHTTVWQYWLGIAKPKNVFRLLTDAFSQA